MRNGSQDVVGLLPPRGLTDGERELLRQWTSLVAGKLFAYLSQRRRDSPATFGRIVVTRHDARLPMYLVYCPAGTSFWVMTAAADGAEVGRFPTLRAALNCIHKVLPT
jgi:hypothetical protein